MAPGTGQGPGAPQPEGKRYAAHHALLDGDVAYLGYGDAGMVVLDVAEITRPRQLARLAWEGGDTHTCLPLPGRKLVVVTDEQVVDGDAELRLVRVVDIADPAAPRVVGVCPEPERVHSELRFGPHNLHENQPGSYSSEQLVSSPTSAPASSSTTSRSRRRPGSSAAGSRRRRPARRHRRRTTSSSTPTASSGSPTGSAAVSLSYCQTSDGGVRPDRAAKDL